VTLPVAKVRINLVSREAPKDTSMEDFNFKVPLKFSVSREFVEPVGWPCLLTLDDSGISSFQ
jgi:hypothetical protein